ncbi:hypothetical protein K7432_016254 [Basidiobolus ranarum]|uniref:Uncharacterized protein n=1 Tax=Basidiobolus ranarum TaxID=34480 RepID=A0ABR2VM32_9FUNG
MTSTVNPKRTLNIVEIGESRCIKFKKYYHISASSPLLATTATPTAAMLESITTDEQTDRSSVKMELDRTIPDYVFRRRNAIVGGALALPPSLGAKNKAAGNC